MAATRQEGGGVEGESNAENHSRNGAVNHDNPILIDVELVQQLIRAVDGSGIDTLEISRAGMRIRISKSPAVAVSGPAAAAPAMAAASVSQPAAGAATPAAQELPGADVQSQYTEIKSPMVGTFYRAPAPEAPPYVEVGSMVSRGQTLCILEAMKLMNEMECEVEGIVREILVDNADPVEYGQVLFRIEPTGSA